MPPPHSQRSLKGFLRKVSYLRRFILSLAEIIAPLGDLLKEKAKFEWKEKAKFEWKDKHQLAFEKVKAVLASPQIMVSPQKGKVNRGTVGPGGFVGFCSKPIEVLLGA
ncbi:hypothetical protein Vadar_023614 [Vaccinium darrowii]|uniref:Uncharacterized protein n=1 Tax=Vaccinium darrowii TaxID=229202 RepID=A0ACB7ZM66_9ERIC|nr:hypothetical protein Vadar_023614 [Vaccinium darrowii]